MIDTSRIRQDFPILQTQMQGHPLIYFDNGATTLKPQCVIDAITGYLSQYSVNAHRGDYDLAHRVDSIYEKVRTQVADLLHCKSEEVIYTYGTSDSLNMVAFGYGLENLKKDDEILLTIAEHASNTLPWFALCNQIGCKVNYIPLDETGRVTIENVTKAITPNTKLISIAQVTNVLGHEVPIKEICALAHQRNIIVCVDAAQSVPHFPVDVQDLDVDFLAFSAHKMCGPTGIGILYGKPSVLEKMTPTRFGGGSNIRYQPSGTYTLKSVPTRFETGTPHIEGVIGMGAAIEYLTSVGLENIYQHEQQLRQYAVSKMQEIENIEVYNPTASGAISFNVKNVFSQDTASLFNRYGIAVRSGQHCAKLLKSFLGLKTTVRASFYLYNTIEEIDQFIAVCKRGDEFLDAFFG